VKFRNEIFIEEHSFKHDLGLSHLCIVTQKTVAAHVFIETRVTTLGLLFLCLFFLGKTVIDWHVWIIIGFPLNYLTTDIPCFTDVEADSEPVARVHDRLSNMV